MKTAPITVVMPVALLAFGYGCVRMLSFNIVFPMIIIPALQKMAVALILMVVHPVVSFNITILIIMMGRVTCLQNSEPCFLLPITSYDSTSVPMTGEKIIMALFQSGMQIAHTA